MQPGYKYYDQGVIHPNILLAVKRRCEAMFGFVHMQQHAPHEHVVHMVTCDTILVLTELLKLCAPQVMCTSRDRAGERR